ncbi:MAG: hypothetical protein JWM28_2830 [Chitinophagaceae bacterium]|nr:hypothetical protein [Chitinophagaceae bacterium]
MESNGLKIKNRDRLRIGTGNEIGRIRQFDELY